MSITAAIALFNRMPNELQIGEINTDGEVILPPYDNNVDAGGPAGFMVDQDNGDLNVDFPVTVTGAPEVLLTAQIWISGKGVEKFYLHTNDDAFKIHGVYGGNANDGYSFSIIFET